MYCRYVQETSLQKKYELILHINIVCMHDVSEICMALCIRLYVTQHLFYYYRSFNQELNLDTTTQQCQRLAERGQAGQVMAWALPEHRTQWEGSVSTA